VAVVSAVAVVSFVLDELVAVLHATSTHNMHAASESCFIKSCFEIIFRSKNYTFF
jgi:hypothetical protein